MAEKIKAICGKCGADLSTGTDLSSAEDSPCPECGCRMRNVHITVKDTCSATDYLSTTGRKEGRAVGFRESERQGRVASADENDDGLFSYTLTGTSPQGEEDTLPTCRILIQTLNAAGATWCDLAKPKNAGVVDCTAVNRANRKEELNIQVVRAITDGQLWEKLARDGKIRESDVDKNALLELIKDSINKKARMIPCTIRRSIVLALDATRLPALTLDSVVSQCRDVLGPWIVSLGFQSVWLVGPTPDLTWQLDTQT